MRKNGPVKRALRKFRLIKRFIIDKTFMRKRGPIIKALRITILILWNILDFAFDIDVKIRRIIKRLKPYYPLINSICMTIYFATRLTLLCIAMFLDFIYLTIIAFTFMLVYHTFLHKSWSEGFKDW